MPLRCSIGMHQTGRTLHRGVHSSRESGTMRLTKHSDMTMKHDEAPASITESEVPTPPLRRRKAQIRETNEAQLLLCAEAVFAEKGLEGASTAMIAERAGLPKANLHYYFPTKLALYRRVLEDLFEDWHRAADTFECSDDPVEAIGGYVRAKMELSRRRPLGSKVWASEIIHGAQHMQDILNERVKPWLDTRVTVIQSWIERGLLAPVDPQTFMFMIWAITQHYADFDAQIRALKGKRALTSKGFDEQTEEVVRLVIRACGAKSKSNG